MRGIDPLMQVISTATARIKRRLMLIVRLVNSTGRT
jgi:hypothetical protein